MLIPVIVLFLSCPIHLLLKGNLAHASSNMLSVIMLNDVAPSKVLFN